MQKIILLILACLLTACASRQLAQFPKVAPLPNAARLNASSTRDWIIQHAHRKTGATFISRNGRMYGMDSDAGITFRNNNRVEVTEFGYAADCYQGTFLIDALGAIHLKLRAYPAKWPGMYLYQDMDGALLFPADGDSSFKMGGRAGAVTSSAMAPYWPFRYKNP